MQTLLRELPTEPIETWLRRRISEGVSPEDVVAEALEPLAGSGYFVWAKPGMRSLVASIHAQISLRLKRSALSPTSSEPVWRSAMKRISSWTFKDGNGKHVVWSDSTPEDHQSRLLWITGHVMSLEEDKIRHICALELFDEHGAQRLGDIPGWEELWRKKVLDRGVEPLPSSSSDSEAS